MLGNLLAMRKSVEEQKSASIELEKLSDQILKSKKDQRGLL